jgi:putative transposase
VLRDKRSNKAAHIAVGVDMDGVKHVLSFWVQPNEGVSFWAYPDLI